MEENLVIVESPGKVGTIQKILGKDYVVKASFGHIRDLQDKKLSVDIEHGFKPEYVIPADKKKVVADLKARAAKATTVWLASDEDREGEAISWHLYEALGLKDKDTKRIVFHEITPDAILNAVQNPREILMDKVNAQQARRVLDRLVGFELSPVLWRKIQPKLSAGRVQSVALRLIVDKEREIMAFQPEAYYKVDAVFHPAGTPARLGVKATLDSKFPSIVHAREFMEHCQALENSQVKDAFSVSSVERKEGTRTPAAPFTTSTLQQEASRKLGFSVNTTMSVAQALYERGLITYMRTDSTNLSSLAINTAKKFIISNFGENYSKVRNYKTKTKGAQEAHEAIRPTYFDNVEIEGSPQEKKLYKLIWRKAIASQMADAKLMRTTIKTGVEGRSEKFVSNAEEILFDGFLKVYSGGYDEAEDGEGTVLPVLNEGTAMEPKTISALGKFTTPPLRYSEGSLVKKLEELEIGRPSTYGPTISTLTKGRGYVVKGDKPGEKKPVTNLSLKDGSISESNTYENVGAEKGKFIPEEIGMIVTDFLLKNFPEIIDYDFTASVENDFDKISSGKLVWNEMIGEFYKPFHNKVDEVTHDGQYSHVSREIGPDPKDGEMLVAKFGKFGPYVQKGDGENKQYASLAPGQLIETITLAEAAALFALPRTVGVHNGVEIKAFKGRFGPFIKYGETNISLPKKSDPLSVSLEECVSLIESNKDKASGKDIIAEWKESDIQIINGRYGAYIKHDGGNYKLPKGTDASTLTEERCKEIIAATKPTGKRFKKGK